MDTIKILQIILALFVILPAILVTKEELLVALLVFYHYIYNLLIKPVFTSAFQISLRILLHFLQFVKIVIHHAPHVIMLFQQDAFLAAQVIIIILLLDSV